MIRRWQICVSRGKKVSVVHAAPSALISYLGMVLLYHLYLVYVIILFLTMTL